jgi:hypothetical protein
MHTLETIARLAWLGVETLAEYETSARDREHTAAAASGDPTAARAAATGDPPAPTAAPARAVIDTEGTET